MHLVGFSHELFDIDLDTTDKVIASSGIRIPKHDTKSFFALDFVLSQEQCAGFFKDRVEVLENDPERKRCTLEGKETESRIQVRFSIA